MDLTLSRRSYTATSTTTKKGAEGFIASSKPGTISNPESHATIQSLQQQLEDLALKISKGSKLFDQLHAADDPRADAVAEKIAAVSAEYMEIHEEWDALLGPSAYGCIECKHPPDIWKVPATSRLCGEHAVAIRAARARLKAI